jgi:hypothetical protein
MRRFGQVSRLAIVLPVIASLQLGNGWATDDTSGPSAPSKNNACPVTKPNGQGLPGADGTQGNHGDGAGLATSLWHGATVFKPGGPGCVGTDGSLWMKWPWWRGKRGPLSVSGQSVDGSPGAVKAAILPYGETGFQATALVFPGPGCWEVTGQVGDATISFVVEAVKVGQGPQSPCDALFPAAAIRSLR